MKECSQGDISYVRLLNSQNEKDFTNVILFGANYNEYFPIKNIYKALNIIKPDALLV